ncbi:MAG TPA: 3-carboxy-cis,cis-muconate cycloisomerase [Devosiaceae bacterium]|jgi:3-carboxy-cis,cis-muconate cycloisomerase
MTLLQALLGDAEIEALFTDAADLAAILRFEAALAGAEADAGLITEADAAAIAAGIARFEPDWDALADGMATDGVVIPGLVKQLRAVVGEPHGVAVHKGATSQDAVDTSLVLRLAPAIGILIERLTALEGAFAALAETFGNQPLMAHTRMQVALPVTVADKLATWSEPLARHRASLSAIRRRLLVIQLGGPVGNRGSFDGKGDAVARYLASRLDLGLAPSWHSQRDPLVEFGSLLSLLSGSLGKFGADVALLAQNEVASIKLAGGGGSSAMAHKSNPVNAEVLVSLARHSAGITGTLHQALVHENERSGAAWTLEWLTLPQLVLNAGASLRLAAKLAGQISFPNS